VLVVQCGSHGPHGPRGPRTYMYIQHLQPSKFMISNMQFFMAKRYQENVTSQIIQKSVATCT